MQFEFFLESGTLWGANFAKKIAKHGGHACLEVSESEIHICEFLSGHLRSKKSLFPQWEPVFFQKVPETYWKNDIFDVELALWSSCSQNPLKYL